MKMSRAFIVMVIALMAVIILFQLRAPSRFDWTNFSHSYKSKQPFGCYVMDSVLRASLPQGYEVVGTGIDAFIGDSSRTDRHTFIITNEFDDFWYSINVSFSQLIKEGNNVVIACDNVYSYNDEAKQMGFYCKSMDYIYRDYSNKETLSDPACYDTIHWHPDALPVEVTYLVNSAFCTNTLWLSDHYRTVATMNRSNVLYNGGDIDTQEEPCFTVAGVRQYGKGTVVVVSMPLIYTNYGILNDTIRPLALRLLSECGDLPVVRYDPSHIDKIVDGSQGSESPLRYLLANRPLRWAFYLALAAVVALVVFTARRRQRVIPVIKPPVNHMMDFVKRIGGIYYNHHDNVDLVVKKYASLCNDLRARAMIDVDDPDHLDEELQLLSQRTGIPLDELRQAFSDISSATREHSISDERMRRLIDVMNNIQQHIINI